MADESEQPAVLVAPAEQHSEAEATEDDDETTTDEEHADASGKKSKKKKKKKKKKSAGSEAGSSDEAASSSSGAGTGTAAGVSAADKAEADRRFHKALESAKQSEDMWVLLGNAHIHDAKARRLADSLRGNSSITSINLSANSIGDEGVKALAEVLGAGGASELINLDLRGNELSAEAEAVLAGLRKQRKQLVINTGPLPDEAADSSSSSSNGAGAAAGKRARLRNAAHRAKESVVAHQPHLHHHHGQQQQQQVGAGDRQWEGQSLKDLVKHSPMLRHYFQTGDEDEGAGSSGEEEGEQQPQLPPPEEVWGQVSELLPRGVACIPQLAEALGAVSRALDAEMSSMPALEDGASMEDFSPHFRAVLEHMPLLGRVLQLQPQPQLNQFDGSDKPQPAVGSHRVWACAILHMLLLHNNPIIDKAVHEAGLLPAAVALALAHPRCSALQCRAVEMLRNSLQSSLPELWQGLFTEGYGISMPAAAEAAAAAAAGDSSSSGGDGGGRSSGLQPALQDSLVQLAASAHKQPVGSRSCVVGFAAELANTLLQAADAASKESHCPALEELLAGCAAWQGSIQQGGPMHGLLQEQDGQLCGPPPPRPSPSVDSTDDGDAPVGGLSNSAALMALLSRMGELSAS